MAAGIFIFTDQSKLQFFSAAGLLAANTANFRLALVTNAWVPNNATDTNFANVSAAELPNGGGYTSGGGALTGVVLNQTSGTVKFTSATFVWTASGGGIPVWRRGVVYYLGTLNAVVNPLLGYFLGDGTDIDVPATTAPNTLTFTPNAAGILTAT